MLKEGESGHRLGDKQVTNDEYVEQVCQKFAAMLNEGRRVRIEDLLNETRNDFQTTLLEQLIFTELEHRWTQGEAPTLDEYLVRFPSDADSVSSLPSRIKELAQRFPTTSAKVNSKSHGLEQLGHFNIKSELGRGAFGAVWLAYDTKMKRQVAIKCITHSGDLERNDALALHEAQAAATLNHPNIVQVFSIEEFEGKQYLIAEYIDGIHLGQERVNGSIDIKKSAYICQKIAEALHHAHVNEIIHRDVKPANIIINSSGEPKLTDFGIAKLLNAEKTLSSDGMLIGSVRYMSPEQARGAELDGRSDVYSLGAVLYELLTSKPPFDGSVKEILFCHQFRDPASLNSINRKIPLDLETICLKALSKNVQERFNSAQEMADDLRRFCEGLPIRSRRTSIYNKTLKRIRRQPVFAGVSLLCLVMFAISVFAIAQVASTASPHKYGQWNVKIKTDPPNATVKITPIDPITHQIKTDGKFANPQATTPLSVWLPPGIYRIQVKHEGHVSAEVERLVPDIGAVSSNEPFKHRFWFRDKDEKETIGWLEIPLCKREILSNMVRIPGTTEIKNLYPGFDESEGIVNPFYVSRVEFKLRDYLQRHKTVPDHHKLDSPETPFRCSQMAARHCAEQYGGRLLTLKEINHLIKYTYLIEYKESPVDALSSPIELISLRSSLVDGISEWTDDLTQLSTSGRVFAYQIIGNKPHSKELRPDLVTEYISDLRPDHLGSFRLAISDR